MTIADEITAWNAKNPVGCYGILNMPRSCQNARVQAEAREKNGVMVATFYGRGELPAHWFFRDATND